MQVETKMIKITLSNSNSIKHHLNNKIATMIIVLLIKMELNRSHNKILGCSLVTLMQEFK